jgi:hypothetical protein
MMGERGGGCAEAGGWGGATQRGRSSTISRHHHDITSVCPGRRERSMMKGGRGEEAGSWVGSRRRDWVETVVGEERRAEGEPLWVLGGFETSKLGREKS